MRKREDEITVRIAKNISVFRKNFGLTQIKLASMLGVDPDTVRSSGRARWPWRHGIGGTGRRHPGSSKTQKKPPAEAEGSCEAYVYTGSAQPVWRPVLSRTPKGTPKDRPRYPTLRSHPSATSRGSWSTFGFRSGLLCCRSRLRRFCWRLALAPCLRPTIWPPIAHPLQGRNVGWLGILGAELRVLSVCLLQQLARDSGHLLSGRRRGQPRRINHRLMDGYGV